MILSDADLCALWLTLKLATVSTLLLLLICTPLAWWLAHSRWRGKLALQAFLALPLVMPPTVLGFYLLLALGPDGPIGALVGVMGGPNLAFSFSGLVIGSLVYSLPFVLQPLQQAFTALGRRPLEVAATLGASRLDAFFSVALPLCRQGLLGAFILGFAHTLGEFGVVLMIGGNIPGQTQVVSIAIYEHVETLEYGKAHALSAILLGLSFLLLLSLYLFNRRADWNPREF